MSSADTEFDLSRLGECFKSPEVEIAAEATQRFAEATNDDNDDFRAGRLAPPLYAAVPPLETMVAAKNAVTPAFAFHGDHDLVVHTPLRPGMTVRSTATVVGILQRSAGVATIIRTETHARDGRLVNEQHFTSFVSGASVAESVGEEAPSHVPPPPDSQPMMGMALSLDPDQTQRFAVASGDWESYTLDEKAAQALGFPAVIVHGTCTMALAGRAVIATVCDGDSTRLQRFAVRLSRPLLLVPGQNLTTRIWAVEVAGERNVYGFEAVDRDKVMVLKNGWVEVAN